MKDFASFLKAEPSFGGVHTPSTFGGKKPIPAPAQTPVQSPAPVTQVPPPKKPKAQPFVVDDETESDIIKFVAPTMNPRHLKPMDENNSFTPLPFDANAMGHIRPDQTPRFFSALTDSDKLGEKTLPMNSLTAMQNRVNTGKVQSMMSSPPDKLPVVARMAGRNYIVDGHHRAAAEWLKGSPSLKAKYIDLEPHSDALKDWEPPVFKVAKANLDKQMIFGWASVVEKDGMIVIDKQGSVILPEDLEAAAYNYMLKSRDQGHMHSTMGVGKCIESMVFTKEKQDIMGIDLKKVAWWTGFLVNDADVWKQHKEGKLNEFSIGGAGKRIDI